MGEEEAELGEGFLHFVDGSGAVDKLKRTTVGCAGKGIAGDEGE